jgi:hypothetical protein
MNGANDSIGLPTLTMPAMSPAASAPASAGRSRIAAPTYITADEVLSSSASVVRAP